MDHVRTFIALEVADSVRDSIARQIESLRHPEDGVKWVAIDHLHFTLKFLGDVPAGDIPDVCRALAEAVRDLPAFDFEVAGVGAFPHPGRPATVWVGAGDGGTAISDLARRIEKALKPLGYPPEGRRFTPHVTIGRVRHRGPQAKELSQAIKEAAGGQFGRSRAVEAVVFSSQLGPGGPTYTPLARAPLQG